MFKLILSSPFSIYSIVRIPRGVSIPSSVILAEIEEVSLLTAAS